MRKPYTYIHTYMHTYIHAYIQLTDTTSLIMGNSTYAMHSNAYIHAYTHTHAHTQIGVVTPLQKCRRPKPIYEAFQCPPGHYKLTPTEINRGCDAIGRPCPPAFTCVCRPCVLAEDVQVRVFMYVCMHVCIYSYI
jgi:hypothetical protein